jgi:hypothetical protein
MSTLLPAPNKIHNVSDLKQLQQVMAAALMRPLTAQGGLAPDWADGQTTVALAARFIKPNHRLTSFERLEIYSRQYWFRLLDCLHDDYPGLRALLGKRKFQALCQDYLAAHPSQSWTLRNLGRELPKFIPAWSGVGGKLAMAVDLARFEWAQIVAFDEQRRRPISVDDLLDAGSRGLTLALQPYLVLLDLNYAVDDYFMGVRSNEEGLRGETSNAREMAPKGATIKRIPPPKRHTMWMAVHRFDDDLYFKRLEREAFLTLRGLASGLPLEDALASALSESDPATDWAGKARGWFEDWAALGWFCAAGEES